MNRILIELMLANIGGPVTPEEAMKTQEEWEGVDRILVATTKTSGVRDVMMRGGVEGSKGSPESVDEYLSRAYDLNDFEKSSLANIIHTCQILTQMGMESLSYLTILLVGLEAGRLEIDPDRLAAALDVQNFRQGKEDYADDMDREEPTPTSEAEDDTPPSEYEPTREQHGTAYHKRVEEADPASGNLPPFEEPIQMPPGGITPPNERPL